LTVADRDAAARDLILTRLAQSREELRRRLDPPPEERKSGATAANGHAGFPRSRTMQMLLSGRGLGTLGALAGGLLIARPMLALRLLRFVPAGSVAKLLMARVMSALKEKPQAGE
jgi:hypothetical protein